MLVFSQGQYTKLRTKRSWRDYGNNREREKKRERDVLVSTCWATPPRNKIHITEIDVNVGIIIRQSTKRTYAHTYSYTKRDVSKHVLYLWQLLDRLGYMRMPKWQRYLYGSLISTSTTRWPGWEKWSRLMSSIWWELRIYGIRARSTRCAGSIWRVRRYRAWRSSPFYGWSFEITSLSLRRDSNRGEATSSRFLNEHDGIRRAISSSGSMLPAVGRKFSTLNELLVPTRAKIFCELLLIKGHARNITPERKEVWLE